jgi:hypothetical protein
VWLQSIDIFTVVGKRRAQQLDEQLDAGNGERQDSKDGDGDDISDEGVGHRESAYSADGPLLIVEDIDLVRGQERVIGYGGMFHLETRKTPFRLGSLL